MRVIEKHAHFNRERIPECVLHAKGSGAYGTFTVTHDITWAPSQFRGTGQPATHCLNRCGGSGTDFGDFHVMHPRSHQTIRQSPSRSPRYPLGEPPSEPCRKTHIRIARLYVLGL